MKKIYTLEEKYELILKKLKQSTSKNPVDVAVSVMNEDFVSMHGPEHHLIDGGSFLTAYKNAGGQIDLDKALDELIKRSKMMPGGMCGLWGVCGSITSVGAALSIINEVGPLTNNENYKRQMEFTSHVLEKMSKLGGPRCCKRNCYLSLSNAASFIKLNYGIDMEVSLIQCDFSNKNSQCIKDKCPFYNEKEE